jgi:uncharacterized protein (DUF433 family)
MNAPLNWSEIARAGGFSTSDVARLVHVPVATISTWLKGVHPVVLPDYEPLNGRLLMSFDALIEARAVAYFADQLPLAKLRGIMRHFREVTGEAHPLSKDQKFVTDGFRLFEKDGEKYVNVVNQVYAEPTLTDPLVKGKVVYDNGAARYFMPDPLNLPLVRIDPRFAFGKPVVVDNGHAVTTSALAESAAEEGVAEAANWFEVSVAAVEQAQKFQERQAA